MAGITRIHITDEVNGRGAWRFQKSRARQSAANQIYRKIFAGLGMPLLPGYEQIDCTMEEFVAGYDHALGIDTIFTFESGNKAMAQEKFLYTKFQTVTVEYMQDWRRGIQGDWFNLRTDYYFTGYDRKGLIQKELGKGHTVAQLAHKWNLSERALQAALDGTVFQEWIMLDWPAAIRATNQGRIRWHTRPNTEDGARANFRYAKFERFPPTCIIDSEWYRYREVQAVIPF